MESIRTVQKIVQIGPYPEFPNCMKGGVEASVYGLAQEQGKMMEVHVFDTPRMNTKSGVARDGNVVVHRYNNAGKTQVSAVKMVKTIADEIVRQQPDVCHIHGTSLYAWQMYRVLKRKGMRIAVTVHGLVKVEKSNLLKQKVTIKRLVQYAYQGFVEKRFLSRLPSAIVDTEYVKEKVVEYPVKRIPEMCIIPQGINEDYFSLSCSENSKVILSVGAFGERKGHLLTLRAFEMLRSQGVTVQWVVAGTIAHHGYFDLIRKEVSESMYKDDIRLLPNVSYRDLKDLYKTAHLFVLHTQEESQGIVFAEAMATGMPVVATKVGGVPFVVKDGRTGFLVNYGDVSLFASQIKAIMSDVSLWQFMSTNAQNESENYHWSTIAKQVSSFYQSVVD